MEMDGGDLALCLFKNLLKAAVQSIHTQEVLASPSHIKHHKEQTQKQIVVCSTSHGTVLMD